MKNIWKAYKCWKAFMRQDVSPDGLVAFVFWSFLNGEVEIEVK